jgi:hypothetical protein
VTRNTSDPLNIKDPLSGDLSPLRNGLGGDAPNGFREGGRATGFVFGEFASFFHAPIESISFKRKQAPLSVKVTM